ncbi:MAG: class F420-dependent oxidoreductase [Frankiales bacterium]|jgi:alkanesulfonate monooxygenase SsuD/methylene tetrahydromethanopterin reductase-like flavin-dependent oxidoreductase (luciferase family)|nr:class F420-dependent oxidoreductase [Frankiales bacterium]
MTGMQIGVGLDARLGLTFAELREAARQAALLGFESAWTPAGGVPDAFHVCAAWSQDSPLLQTGISVVPVARNWTVTAVAIQAATVGQIAGGRFTLGIGSGGSGPAFWSSAGLPNRPIAVMRDYLTILRGLLNGERVTYEGAAVQVRGATLVSPGMAEPLASVPIQLGALGPQMVRLAGELGDGALLNWATPERIAQCRQLLNEGAARADRDPSQVRLTMYVRICVDDDVEAARQALGAQVLGYAIGTSATHPPPRDSGYRAAFTAMGFDDVLTELEQRRAAGESFDALVRAAPDELFSSVGYFGPADGAPAAYARLSEGLDETIVRVITARPGIEPVISAMAALTPARIRSQL